MASNETITAELIERELITVDLYVVDILTGATRNLADLEDVNITSPVNDEILVYENGYMVNKNINVIIDTFTVKSEIPTPAPPVTAGSYYTTAYTFQNESLEVFLNGMKLLASDFIIHSTTEFSIVIDTIISDAVVVNYTKQ